ncbi:carbonic anhydrase [Ketobacter sp. MCCC 1A13808]|uniref:carbonic anhydrase n=1 Tax=Ketobacter sp. MCCC 1A13808 TaxID=2602738 RepID=UPI000F250688|nr:carbonic anhydrase [Ketobacter sp. MCCC 1A13808]MVF13375.1 carbonic anhydrase [Ketobacter sp. MCCC 1A13808]RLP54354.1 MAG: carbonic anhydrase [Ketobacter sp.]
MITAQQALTSLKEGNQRFVSGLQSIETRVRQMHSTELVEGQAPFAIVLGCSDSRVPAEIIFDQGLGDLFVIRVAGNIVAPSQIGSIEYAVSQFGTPLVVVLGHSQCGAVAATIDVLSHRETLASSHVLSIVNRIRPSVEPLFDAGLRDDRPKLMQAAVRANVRASANHLRHGSAMLEPLIAAGSLTIVGAEYSLENGEVDFFEGL